MKNLLFSLFALVSALSYGQGSSEKHLRNIRQLTHGGDNAEAYFSFSGKELVFQSNFSDWGVSCDQIFTARIKDLAQDTSFKPRQLSNGEGRTTCSYFLKGDQKVLYATTEGAKTGCPPLPESQGAYVWPIYPEYDIFVHDLKTDSVQPLTQQPGYDAEATVSPDGKSIVFTSLRSGDLELWIMNADGSEPRQITYGLGYDGGAFFSPDSKSLVFRASRPKSPEEQERYRSLLNQGLVEPTNMEIYTVNVDGSNLKQITNLGKANWAPFFHPSGKKIIFSSNHHSPRGYDFQLYLINTDGSGLERVTDSSMFNAFPMFSPNGKYLIFSSNRNNGGTRDTNLFLAEWVD